MFRLLKAMSLAEAMRFVKLNEYGVFGDVD